MKLGELAFACHVFGLMSDYDSSYKQFLDSTHPIIDLRSDVHLKALLKWLNAWGCRQFAIEYHTLASNEIKEWYSEFNQHLLPLDATILTMTEKEFKLVERAYASLVEKTASYRNLYGERKSLEKVGPTGAAKILFALRPNALIPWDGAMRKEFGFDGSNHSYGEYLRKVRNDLESVSLECKRNGFELKDLPIKLGRLNSSITKLMDEYHWVTITRRCPAPSKEELRLWMDWS
jgi:hypothetical protein